MRNCTEYYFIKIITFVDANPDYKRSFLEKF